MVLYHTVKQHSTSSSSHMHHSVTGCSPSGLTKGIDVNKKKKKLKEQKTARVTFSTDSLQKVSGYNKFN